MIGIGSAMNSAAEDAEIYQDALGGNTGETENPQQIVAEGYVLNLQDDGTYVDNHASIWEYNDKGVLERKEDGALIYKGENGEWIVDYDSCYYDDDEGNGTSRIVEDNEWVTVYITDYSQSYMSQYSNQYEIEVVNNSDRDISFILDQAYWTSSGNNIEGLYGWKNIAPNDSYSATIHFKEDVCVSYSWIATNYYVIDGETTDINWSGVLTINNWYYY